MVVQSQQWTGTFTADSTCNTTVCCCLGGTIVVKQSSTSILAISSGLSGQCNNLTTLSNNASYSNGYTGNMTITSQNLTFILTLSNDSKSIFAIASTDLTCYGTAYKNAAIKQMGNIMTVVALLLMGLRRIVF